MRILLGLILALSVSFACDQPYEEVGGYKIGCKLDNIKEYNILDENSDANAIQYSKGIEGFFDKVTITTIDDRIEWVGFERNKDRKFTKLDVDDLLSSLNARWGDPKEENSAYIITPDSNTVGLVYFYSSSIDDDNTFALMYKSKKFIEIEKRFEREHEEKRKDDILKF